ncbi:unnamed protein product [Periconia digitata]|uniref:Uncharacterized protein n=1 Tax=Periconia digitata TaxID=1303443 RepID=A0A9W4UDA3_9PLEO|nr:unnamed protein product [Periconia digitata]
MIVSFHQKHTEPSVFLAKTRARECFEYSRCVMSRSMFVRKLIECILQPASASRDSFLFEDLYKEKYHEKIIFAEFDPISPYASVSFIWRTRSYKEWKRLYPDQKDVRQEVHDKIARFIKYGRKHQDNVLKLPQKDSRTTTKHSRMTTKLSRMTTKHTPIRIAFNFPSDFWALPTFRHQLLDIKDCTILMATGVKRDLDFLYVGPEVSTEMFEEGADWEVTRNLIDQMIMTSVRSKRVKLLEKTTWFAEWVEGIKLA